MWEYFEEGGEWIAVKTVEGSKVAALTGSKSLDEAVERSAAYDEREPQK